MKTNEICITPEMEKILRVQRHDFINYVQVLHAYMQLGKIDKAADYLDKMVKEINEGTFCSEYISSLPKKSHDTME